MQMPKLANFPLELNTNRTEVSPGIAPFGKYFQIQNRRFLGNKYRLLDFIADVVQAKCGNYESFCDIFAGTGVVGHYFNNGRVKIISNDILYSSYRALRTFLGIINIDLNELERKIDCLNHLTLMQENYFSINYGNTFFTAENARRIGLIRENIDHISDSEDERHALVTSLIYAADRVANTVGHYDAYRSKLDMTKPLRLLIPEIHPERNRLNEVYREDANNLIRKISSDVLYIDPPYNSRQYSDTYHLLENLATWGKPLLYGKAKKMDRQQLKSQYCTKTAEEAFADLIENAKCNHILVSYNNTGRSKDSRSNARITDEGIYEILKSKGIVEVFEKTEKPFTAGKSDTKGYTERVFYCKVRA